MVCYFEGPRLLQNWGMVTRNNDGDRASYFSAEHPEGLESELIAVLLTSGELPLLGPVGASVQIGHRSSIASPNHL